MYVCTEITFHSCGQVTCSCLDSPRFLHRFAVQAKIEGVRRDPISRLNCQPCSFLLRLAIFAFLPILSMASSPQSTKPKLRVAADGLPSGHDTPEGAACDLARAFIAHDEKLFTSTSIRLYGDGAGREAYAKFLGQTVEGIKAEAAKKEPSAREPKSIGKVFAARHLSKSGPVSYGNAVFGFQDIMFVDVGVYLQNGDRAINRTMVIKDRDGKWYVHPAPNVSPLLREGLNDEDNSVLDITDVYELEP
jgi:hypothetical protein